MTNELPLSVGDLDTDPRLLVGWRTRSKLDGRRLDVHEDTHEVLREIAAACLDHIHADDTEIRDYQSFSTLESDQVFRVDSDDASTVDLESASLVQLVQESHQQELLDASELAEHHYAFYAIVWGSADGEQIGFVRKRNARATLEKGQRFFRYEETLRSAARPDFVLDTDVDLVVHGSTLYMLNENSARTLLNDVGLASAGITDNLAAMKDILGGSSSLTPDASAAFIAVASRKINVARRLAKIPAFFDGMTIDAAKLRLAAEARFSDPDTILDSAGVICVSEEGVEAALDLIEGRLYMDDVSGEERRADRLSRRSK